ncbi:unnamed protein product [Pleuronectes platessa]|uniref:Uncharacterized protein n=1 Tax=Pleuronectes platessa TaxID=8262 RepID=A0A9N7YJE8_PLEPL|nr:unnamed protein product [Pleuronectes platessa]
MHHREGSPAPFYDSERGVKLPPPLHSNPLLLDVHAVSPHPSCPPEVPGQQLWRTTAQRWSAGRLLFKHATDPPYSRARQVGVVFWSPRGSGALGPEQCRLTLTPVVPTDHPLQQQEQSGVPGLPSGHSAEKVTT